MEINIQSAIQNRRKLKESLPASIIILKGRDEVVRSNDCHYPFRQYSDFLYLTGIERPYYSIILTPDKDYLFIPKINTKHIIWLGSPMTPDETKKIYGFDIIYSEEQFDLQFAKICGKKHVFPFKKNQQGNYSPLFKIKKNFN